MKNMHGVEIHSISEMLIEVDGVIRRNSDDLVRLVRSKADFTSIYKQAEFLKTLAGRREGYLRRLERLGISEADFYSDLRRRNEAKEEGHALA